jgi:hypothetical protein
MAVIGDKLYESILLATGQARQRRDAVLALFRLLEPRPLCGIFYSGGIFSGGDSTDPHPRKSCARYAARHCDCEGGR